MKIQYSVGDRFKIKVGGFSRVKIGDICTIVEIRSDRGPDERAIMDLWVDSVDHLWYDADEIDRFLEYIGEPIYEIY